MARDYGRKQTARRKSNFPRQLIIAFIAFLSGYLGASLIDLTTITSWVNKEILAQRGAQETGGVAKPTTRHAQLPKPKFEFYTLLASERAVASERLAANKAPVVGATSIPPAVPLTKDVPDIALLANQTPNKSPVVLAKESYLIQIASFKGKQDAERMRASLMLKGFNVNIVTATQKQTNWYRVIIGPFATRQEAQKAQSAIARSEHIMGMIRKMDA